MNFNQLSKSAGVVIPRCFCISKCFKDKVGLQNLTLHSTSTTSKCSQVLHCMFSCLCLASPTFPTYDY
uniref:Myosin vIII n=1 Tax=Rhizophora mucronata TaxID=61149 RepID=A0A2P2M4P4_RHIMU